MFKGLCYSNTCPDGAYLLTKEQTVIERKLLLQNHSMTTDATPTEAKRPRPRDDGQSYGNLDDILPHLSTSPSPDSVEERAIMQPKIQNLCGKCHESCLTCSESSETDCLNCPIGFQFLNLEKSELNTEHGVCVKSQTGNPYIRRFNENLLIIVILLIFVLAFVMAMLYVRRRAKKEVRDNYKYDQIDTGGLLADDEDTDDLPDSIAYRTLQKKFRDFDEEEAIQE